MTGNREDLDQRIAYLLEGAIAEDVTGEDSIALGIAALGLIILRNCGHLEVPFTLLREHGIIE